MSYGVFARFYDSLTDDVERDEMEHFIRRAVKRFGSDMSSPVTLCDIGCGTAVLSVRLAKDGFDVTGVDASEEMLSVAYEHMTDAGVHIQPVLQDMTSLDLGGTWDVFISTLDGLCHLPDLSAAEDAIGGVARHCHKGSLFIFDMNTPYKHREVLSGQTFVYDTDDVYCVWQNSEADENCRIDMLLDLFEYNRESYDRFVDELSETAFDPQAVDDILIRSGFEILGEYDGYTDSGVTDTTERTVRICRYAADE